eukprot:1329434-Amphidinium_carterae.1
MKRKHRWFVQPCHHQQNMVSESTNFPREADTCIGLRVQQGSTRRKAPNSKKPESTNQVC